MVVKNITNSDQYYEFLAKEKSTVASFGASWCQATESTTLAFEKLAEKFENKAHFLCIDVDEMTKLASDEQVRGLPTFIVYKDGIKTKTVCGGNVEVLSHAIEETLDRYKVTDNQNKMPVQSRRLRGGQSKHAAYKEKVAAKSDTFELNKKNVTILALLFLIVGSSVFSILLKGM